MKISRLNGIATIEISAAVLNLISAVVLSVIIAVVLPIQAYAFSNTLELYNPEGIPVIASGITTKTACENNLQCSLERTDLQKACTIEGNYTLRFTIGNSGNANDHPLEKVFNTTTHTVDWNTKKWCHGLGESITCIGGRYVNWSENAGCCGVRASNCGVKAGGKVCAQTKAGEGERWEWIEPSATKGDIINLTCSGTTLVSTGNDLYGCGDFKNIGSKTEIKNLGDKLIPILYIDQPNLNRLYKMHGYICAKDSLKMNDQTAQPQIVECVGEDKAYNNRMGFTVRTGENRTYGLGTVYCRKDGVWAKDLDTNTDASMTTCKAAGLHWTGTKCCSESEDRPSEYYNDTNPENYAIDSQGGCWNSTWGPNGALFIINDTRGKVVVDRGNFYGCQTDLGWIKDILNVHTQQKLVINQNACDIRIGIAQNANYHFYCAKDGYWTYTNNPGKRELKQWDVLPNPTDCCPTGTCYYYRTDPSSPKQTGCIQDQSQETGFNVYEGRRCIGGKWMIVNPKFTWDRGRKGFCKEDMQCLVVPDGSTIKNDKPEEYFTTTETQRPACITDQQSILDHYCSAGKWTSRTKMIALSLIDIGERVSPNDYLVFCDSYSKVLNFVEYKVGDIELSEHLNKECNKNGIRFPCNNNFCVLKYPALATKPTLVMAGSVNVALDSTEYSFLDVLGMEKTACNSVSGNAIFGQCGNSPVFYSRGLNAFMITTASQLIVPTFSSASQRDTILLVKRDELKTFITSQAGLSSVAGFVMNVSDYGSFYYRKESGNEQFAFLERGMMDGDVRKDYLVMLYKGFYFKDPSCPGNYACSLINKKTSGQPQVCTPECSVTTGNTDVKVVSVGGSYTSVWSELTAKLR